MKIELGKTYVTRNGEYVLIKQRLENPVYSWVFRGSNSVYYSESGTSALDGTQEMPQDLISELKHEDIRDAWTKTLDESRHEPVITKIDPDMVNSPSHYLEGGVEAIDMIRLMLTDEEFKGYCKGNMLKYRLRAPFKGKTEEDVNKAAWYYEAARGNK